MITARNRQKLGAEVTDAIARNRVPVVEIAAVVRCSAASINRIARGTATSIDPDVLDALAIVVCVPRITQDRWHALAGHVAPDLAATLLAYPGTWAEVRALLSGEAPTRDELRAVGIETLAVLYAVAPKCDVCREHVAVMRGGDVDVCGRVDCIEVIGCRGCGGAFNIDPRSARPCKWCGSGDVFRGMRTGEWFDLPHAETLRAANAAHDAKVTK